MLTACRQPNNRRFHEADSIHYEFNAVQTRLVVASNPTARRWHLKLSHVVKVMPL